MNDLDTFYLHHKEPNRSCLLALRGIIMDQDPEIRETMKYKMPCFCYREKAFCYLWVDNKTGEPYLLLVEGKHLTHPDLESGSRSKMKIFRINPSQDIPLSTIESLIHSALELYKKGIIKI